MMTVDALLSVIVGGFMCICGGFGSYGCYRCFVDKEGSSRIHSASETNSQPGSPDQDSRDNLIKSDRKVIHSSGSLSSKDTLLSGTIYTVSSDDSLNTNKNYGESFRPSKMLKSNHEYALSINPQLIGWTMKDDINDQNKEKSSRSKTAPV